MFHKTGNKKALSKPDFLSSDSALSDLLKLNIKQLLRLPVPSRA